MLPVSVATTTMTSLVAIASRLVAGNTPLVLLVAVIATTVVVPIMPKVHVAVSRPSARTTPQKVLATIIPPVVGVALKAPTVAVRQLLPELVVALMTVHHQQQHLGLPTHLHPGLLPRRRRCREGERDVIR